MIDYTDVTPETIAAVKTVVDRQRRELERRTGCTILPDGRLLLPDDQGVGLRIANAMAQAVFGARGHLRG